jgi:hypothetical protein
MKERSRPVATAQREATPAADRLDAAARRRDTPADQHPSPYAAAQRRLIDATFGATRQRKPAQPGTTVQRNEASATLLTTLAKPQVFPGPEIEVQDEIVTRLEKKIAETVEPTNSFRMLSFGINGLGGIELPVRPDDDVETLIGQSSLVDLDDMAVANRHKVLTGDDAQLRAMIVRNTLKTMDRAGQLEYLRTSGLIDEHWKVVVEVHYYRQRDPDARQFHKDTRGQTLFVNLNFLNEAPIAGPEYIINPPRSDEHDQDLTGTLPQVFRDDLATTRERLGQFDTVDIAEVGPKGVVSFVDEAVHHKSPTTEHRAATSVQVRDYLKRHFPAEFDDYLAAFEKREQASFLWRYELAYYLPQSRSKNNALDSLWQRVLEHIKNEKATLNRVQIAALDPNAQRLDPDALADIGGDEHFGQANIPGIPLEVPEDDPPRFGPSRDTTVKHEGHPILKRTMSDKLLAKDAPKPMAGRRAFFRTWVRAVPKAK